MTIAEQKLVWLDHYKVGEQQLRKASNIRGLVSAFNANIDAVIKLSGEEIKNLIQKLGIKESELLEAKETIISKPEDALRGLVKCFSKGIAEEWIIDNEQTFLILKDLLGYGRLQMGGQGGIVANVAAVCGINQVYVHCASLPQEQSGLFLDLPNLKSFTTSGESVQVNTINRTSDVPLIHYILEFDKGDSITIDGQTFTCPKANRFIATFDPLNLQLHIDPDFDNAMQSGNFPYDFLILSGYQLLQENLPNGNSGVNRVKDSAEQIKKWLEKAPEAIMHFEVASTQDKVIRKSVVDIFGHIAHSIGINERELIDILEVIDQSELAEECNKDTHSVNLYKGLEVIFEYMKAPRIQLHMFGLYITIQAKNFKLSPLQNRNGMETAALIAAAKAGTGAIDTHSVLLHAKDEQVSEIGLKELNDLADFIESKYGATQMKETGIFEGEKFDVIAVPTILIEKPVTLVGMGDTISSASLIGASL